MGIIPTDSLPSFVCDLGNRAAIQKLYELKQMNPSKRLSILCRNLQDVATYTMGFPASRTPGQPDLFKIAKRVLPGPVGEGGRRGAAVAVVMAFRRGQRQRWRPQVPSGGASGV